MPVASGQMASGASGRWPAGSAGAGDLEAGSGSSNPSSHNHQQQQQRQDGQAPGAPSSGSSSAPPCQEDHTNQPRSLTRAVNEGLGDDIYAIFVGSMIAYFASTAPPAKVHGCRLYRLGSLVLLTAGLQLALIVLLWRAASNGTPSPEQREIHMIWKQFGNVNKVFCHLRHAKEIAYVELGSGPDKDQTCTDFWPETNTYSDIPDYNTSETCFSMPPVQAFNTSTCKRLISLNSSMLAYGWGFFSNRTTSEQPSRLGSRWKDLGGLFLGGWDDNQFDDGDPFFYIACAYILLAIVVHREVKMAAKLCFIAAVAAGIVPEFYGLMPGPSCWRSRQPRMYRDLPKGKLHRGACACILLAPLLQMFVAVCVMATGGVMFILQLGQSGSVQIVINSVALAFIVELDNYVGSLVAKGWRNSVVLQPAPAQPMLLLEHWNRGWGLAYFAVVGMLLFIEVALLSPQSSAVLLEFVALVLKGHLLPDHGFGSRGLKSQFMRDISTRPSRWFDWNLWFVWAFGGWMDAGMYFRDPDPGINQLTNFGPDPKQQMAFLVFALIMYALASAVVVVFVFSRTIPCASRMWPGGVVISQLLLTLVIQLQSSHFEPRCFWVEGSSISTCRSREWWWFVVLIVLVAAWTCMFVIWPLHASRTTSQLMGTFTHNVSVHTVKSLQPADAAALGTGAITAQVAELPAVPFPLQVAVGQWLGGAEKQQARHGQQGASQLWDMHVYGIGTTRPQSIAAATPAAQGPEQHVGRLPFQLTVEQQLELAVQQLQQEQGQRREQQQQLEDMQQKLQKMEQRLCALEKDREQPSAERNVGALSDDTARESGAGGPGSKAGGPAPGSSAGGSAEERT